MPSQISYILCFYDAAYDANTLIVIYTNQRAYCKKPAKAPANMAFPSHSDQRKQYNAKTRQQFNTEIKL